MQQIYNLQEKCTSLEVERKNLQFKIQRAKLDMQQRNEQESDQSIHSHNAGDGNERVMS